MKNSLKRYRRDFIDYLGRIRGYSDLTLRTYDDALSEALALAEVEPVKEGIRINLMPLRLHIASQKPKTISKKLSAVRSFVEYLREQGETVELQADESIKVPKSLPKPIPHEHIVQALEHAELRDRLVVVMLYTLGLRISELASIRLDDIGDSWVRVHGKGNKEREVPLIDTTSRLLSTYLQSESPSRFLFEKDGDRLSENSLRYIIKKLFKNVGMKVTPHQLRHSYATALLNNNARIADVSDLLGHASMATTQIYTKLGNALKLDNYMKSHPLCKGDNGTQ
ncbi:MAG: tyrosine-type recombinase/integrase [Sulfurimonadaceae bacterium]|nr:tyrosine-type recombinase/integrase [Sulfurimonadaceae bacterium]